MLFGCPAFPHWEPASDVTVFLIVMSQQPSKCCWKEDISANVTLGFSCFSCCQCLVHFCYSWKRSLYQRKCSLDAWNWDAICGFIHCYILFSIPGTCIQCVQMTPSCTSSSFQLTGSVLYFFCFLFFPPSVELRVWLTTKVFLFVVFLSVVAPQPSFWNQLRQWVLLFGSW